MNLGMFPFPHIWRGELLDGSIVRIPSRCAACAQRPCLKDDRTGLQLCPFGINYEKADADLWVIGLVLQDWPRSTPARRQQFRANPIVRNQDYSSALAYYRSVVGEEEAASRRDVERRQEDLLDEEQFRVGYLANLKEEIVRGLSFVHDYKQINTQIIQNINVVIETRYTGGDFDEKLSRATPQERAIYAAARFLDEKLNVAKFLLRPEWLHVLDEVKSFKVHGLVLKYVRIYQALFDGKRVRVQVSGQSNRHVSANAQACGVIPHTLIDNAQKYAPAGSTVEIYVQDEDTGVLLEVTSLGPRIYPDEERRIFRPFFRGRAAADEAEGAGYGLYVSQLVAVDHLGTRIEVEQEQAEADGYPGRYSTTFSVLLPYQAKVLPR